MPFMRFFKKKHAGTLPQVDIAESLAIIMAKRKEFVVKRIPDVAHPCFFVLSSCIAVFYVTIEDTLKIFAVMENKRSPEPFVTSSRFNSSKITFRLGKHCLGYVDVKEEVAWDIIKPDKEKTFQIVKSGDGVSCKIMNIQTQQRVGLMEWEAYWTESDTNVINPIDLPPNASYMLHYDEIDLEATMKALILASTFTVHYSQKRIKPKVCTKKTVMIIGLAVFLFVMSLGPVLHFYSEAMT